MIYSVQWYKFYSVVIGCDLSVLFDLWCTVQLLHMYLAGAHSGSRLLTILCIWHERAVMSINLIV